MSHQATITNTTTSIAIASICANVGCIHHLLQTWVRGDYLPPLPGCRSYFFAAFAAFFCSTKLETFPRAFRFSRIRRLRALLAQGLHIVT